MTTLLIATLLTLLSTVGLPEDQEDSGGGQGELVARVGDMNLSRADFGEWLVQRQGVVNLRDYVQEQLMLRVAEQEGLLPSDDAVAATFAANRQLLVDEFHKGDEESYDESLRLKGYDPATWAALRASQIRVDMCREALAMKLREVTEEEIEKRFKSIYGPDGEHTVIDVLFFNMYADPPADTAPDRAALKATARGRAEFAREALASGTSLEDVLATSDPVATPFVVDGRVDPYRLQLLGPEVEAAVSSLDDPGEMAPPVEVYNGYYVVRLVSREVVTLDEVRDELEELLRNEPLSSEEIGLAEAYVWEQYPVEILLR